MRAMSRPFRMYSDLAEWWPLLSPASEYEEEAADLLPELLGTADAPPRTLLELGAGGGSLAWHLKAHLRLTLSDLSPQMLAVSQTVNPECEHIVGDMRTLDLGRTFDVVLIHDAIMYATTPADAQAALATATRHCRSGGAVMVIPDSVAETLEPDTHNGGSDAPDGRGLRFIEWSWDPDPTDDTFETVYAFVLRRVDGTIEVTHEMHTNGIFPRASWLTWLGEAGIDATVCTDPWGRDVFVGRRR
jgi:ubiquinone/menaquinone biosynthesis C-methylase UbiE